MAVANLEIYKPQIDFPSGKTPDSEHNTRTIWIVQPEQDGFRSVQTHHRK